MKTKTAFVLLSALASTVAWGCGGATKTDGNLAGSQQAALHRAKSCPDLLTDLKADALHKLNKVIDAQVRSIIACQAQLGQTSEQCAYYGGMGGGFATAERGSADSSMGGSAPPQSPSPSPAGESGNTSGGATPTAPAHSETNVQVKGVDEADFVKTDGKNFYLLHGNSLKVIKAFPASAMSELGSATIEGSPSEMFVDGGKIVVYSTVNGGPLFQAAGIKPKETYNDYGYATSGGPMTDGAPSRSPSDPSTGTATPFVQMTKITVLTLSGNTPVVAREAYFEGSYLSSRRVGNHVRTVLQGGAHGPRLKYSMWDGYDGTGPQPAQPKNGTEAISMLEQLRSENVSRIQASTLEEWMPVTFTKQGAGVTTSHAACEDFYVPTVGSTEHGLTEIATLDLANPSAMPRETAILGRSDTVYASADTIYLAARAYADQSEFMGWGGGGGAVDMGAPNTTEPSTPPSSGGEEPLPAPPPAPTPVEGGVRIRTIAAPDAPLKPVAVNFTHVHKFELASDPTFPNYQASGTVAGQVKDQFSLDDKDGFLRIATTEQRMYQDEIDRIKNPSQGSTVVNDTRERPRTASHLFVLQQTGPILGKVGDVGDLAPGERIFSVRFVGTRGYVVTFRQVDPLFVIDLATPQKPEVLAALKIPGFSEYMHPIDDNTLLTIGRDATDDGQVRGLALQIFDVRDGRNPVLKQKFVYAASEYGHSEAEGNHKAFTYFADRGLLAFPYTSYGTSTTSTLELFKVDPASGFRRLGAIDHSPLFTSNPNGYCGGYYDPSVRRGIFVENTAYAISYGGIIAKDITKLTAAGTTFALPAPKADPSYGAYCGGDDMGGGSVEPAPAPR